MEVATLIQLAPLLQYGFAGAWLIQFGVGVWLFLRAIEVLDRVGDTVQANTEVVSHLKSHCEAEPRLSLDQFGRLMHDWVQRPTPSAPETAP